MKIVHIITRLILGGAQENTLITCRLLAQRGHNVTLITGPALGPEGDLYDKAKNRDFQFIIIDSLRRQINPFHDIQAYCRIRKHLRRLKPDIVHTHSAKAGILGRFAAHALKNNWAAGRPAVVHTIHGLAFHPYQSGWLNKFYIAVEKAAANKTDAFITVADAMTNQALAARIGRPEQFTTAYSAIDEEDFLNPLPPQQTRDFRRKHQIPEDAVLLVTIARLFMLKGHEYIIESAKDLAKRFPSACWLFVGDGILADPLKQQVARLGLSDRIKFTGLLPPSQIPLAIQASDILVHCSLREGLARAIPQAMLSAKPAVSFDVDGAREVVSPGTGRLIEPKNVARLTQACAELIQNPQLRQTLGRAAQQSVKQKFAPNTMVNTIEALYRKLLEENPS
jgi:glycosyltransferase involved in cell wall biosynthesis